MVGGVPDKRRVLMKLLKVHPGVTLEVTFVSDELASLRLHWLLGRSYVCPSGDCPACFECGSRWTGFVPVMVSVPQGKGPGICLLEVTESAWARFDGLCRLEGERQLFGLRAQVLRRRRKEPLVIDPVGRTEMCGREPVGPLTLYAALATLYGLPWPAEGETVADWADRVRPAAVRQVEMALARAVGQQ
jgi:hypothetical protein